MLEAKEQVIQLFLSFVSRYVPLGQARLATLGGRGLEAKIWAERGIPAEHGWLIERNRQRNDALITNHRYSVHNQLGTFDRILAGHGKDASIDGFHLDLCGTLCDHAIAGFKPVIPLILTSGGRCLAITVADARRNLVLEQWPAIIKRGKRLFGTEVAGIYQTIMAAQRRVPVNHDRNLPAFIKPFDPVKAAKREFGLLVELAELMRAQDLPWMPATIERYIYVSHSMSRGFRMRTYFFHFGEMTAANAGCSFAQAWVESKIFFANGEAFHEVEQTPGGVVVQPLPTKKGDLAMATSKLHELVSLLGGSYEVEYNELAAASQRLQRFLDALGMGSHQAEAIAAIAPAPVLPMANASLAPAPATASTPSRPAKKRMWYDLSAYEQVEFQIRALEFKRDHPAEYMNGGWKELLKAVFGHYTKPLAASCRAVMARTSGKHRPQFIAKIKKACVGPSEAKAYLDRLAKC
jgi:hypothetical protein